MRRRKCISSPLAPAVFTLALALAPFPAVADTPASAAVPAANSSAGMASPFQYTNGKIVVQAKINGMGPYSLALDSGAETMMITQQVADACKLTVKTGTVAISGTTGNYVPVPQALVDKLSIGDAVVNSPFCTVSPRPISVDGYIGAPLFNAYTVQVDFSTHQITCYPPNDYVPDPADQTVPITFGKHRVPVIQGVVGGTPAKLEVDTGSTFPAELVPSFVEANDLPHKFQEVGSVMTNSVAGPASAKVYGAPSLTVGSSPAVALGANVPTLFLNSGSPVIGDWDGRIGDPVLANYVITFDYAHSRLYIRPAQTPPASQPTTPAEQTAPPPATATPTPTPGSASPAPAK